MTLPRPAKLELTWVGKDERPQLEPRILLEDPSKSYHAARRVTDHDIFDNRIIFGDNLLALKALEQEFAGKVKCVYVDPPFNTGAAFEHYDDALEHSVWLSLMRERFILLRHLLSEDGALFVHLDDHEVAYSRALLDEVFGRANYRNTITVRANSPFGFKHTSESIFKSANFILLYAKSPKFQLNRVFIPRDYDSAYRFVLQDRSAPLSRWKWRLIGDVVAQELGHESSRKARAECGAGEFERLVAEFAVAHARQVFRTAAVSGGARLKRQETLALSAKDREKVFTHPGDDMEYYFIAGERVLFYDERLVEVDGQRVPGEAVTDIWSDVSWEGIAKEGGIDFPKGKKPERLLRRCIELASAPGDLVLDSFAGSGTTGAVAHKLMRRWIMVELREHCNTHIIPRVKSVIDGTDSSGITEAVGWHGGGGFRYFQLAPSLLERDRWGNWIVSKKYSPAMLAQAMCKHEGFTYAPSESTYWIHGRSTEQDFIFVTTQTLTRAQLVGLSEDVGPSRTLLVCCGAYQGKGNEYPNLTVKKIPKAVLHRCEWGRDDYSLKIASLPPAEAPAPEAASGKAPKKRGSGGAEMPLFKKGAK